MEKIVISFSKKELQALNVALFEMPYKLSAPLISSINSQIQQQFNQREEEQTGSNNNLPVTDDSPNNL